MEGRCIVRHIIWNCWKEKLGPENGLLEPMRVQKKALTKWCSSSINGLLFEVSLWRDKSLSTKYFSEMKMRATRFKIQHTGIKPLFPGMLRMKWATVHFDSLTCVPCNHVTSECSKCRDTSPVADDSWPKIPAMASTCHTSERFARWIAWNLRGDDYFSRSDSYPLNTELIACDSIKYFRWTLVTQQCCHLTFHLHWFGVVLLLCRCTGSLQGHLFIHPPQ